MTKSFPFGTSNVKLHSITTFNPFWLKHIFNASCAIEVFFNFELFFNRTYPHEAFLKTCRGRLWNRGASMWNMFDNLLYNILTIQESSTLVSDRNLLNHWKSSTFLNMTKSYIQSSNIFFRPSFLWCEQDCGWLMARLKDHRGLLTWKPVNQDW